MHFYPFWAAGVSIARAPTWKRVLPSRTLDLVGRAVHLRAAAASTTDVASISRSQESPPPRSECLLDAGV